MLTWRIRRAPNNASKWQMEFNSAFKGLRQFPTADAFDERAEKLCTLQNIKSPNVVSFLDWFISGGTTS